MTAQILQKRLKTELLENRLLAADPLERIWVSASAGSGKTTLLVDRVLRLMLPRPGGDAKTATPPDKILCITYTKAAAAEMSERIAKILRDWVGFTDDKLRAELTRLMDVAPTPVIMDEARKLFACVTDVPGRMKIMTIHAFCQSLLKRFPLEAGISPNFTLMDERTSGEILTQCQHQLIAEVNRAPSNLARAFETVISFAADPGAFSQVLGKIVSRRSGFRKLIAKYGSVEALSGAVYQSLGVGCDESEHDVLAGFATLSAGCEADIRYIAKALAEGSKTDVEKQTVIVKFLEAGDARAALFESYKLAFLTKENEVRQRQATKDVEKKYQDVTQKCKAEAARILKAVERMSQIALAHATASLVLVADFILARYQHHKRAHNQLDYDDLINITADLLEQKDQTAWVLYKLDQGLDHILLDEAQDTSPGQWRIIRALTDEFRETHSARSDITRTAFVVGDEKQSIFSFQGADLKKFQDMFGFFTDEIGCSPVALNRSFRSVRPVLDVVNAVFTPQDMAKGVVFDGFNFPPHEAHRAGDAGLVELWPLIKMPKADKAGAWEPPARAERSEAASAVLARKIASTIRGWLDKGEKLVSQDRPISEGDILILLRKRGAFVDQIVRALKEQNIAVAGVDRLILTKHIAVMDLMAMADFALLPEDDLTLATILKTPLIGLGEDEVFDLCYNRGAKSLWQVMQDKNHPVVDYLRSLIALSIRAPYAFFSHLLTLPCPASGVSGKAAVLARLKAEALDPVDELLNACLQFEQSHIPSLQLFLIWLRAGESEVKREQEQEGGGKVRILTVHGSKGLQAPIVFVPDLAGRTLPSTEESRIRIVWPDDRNADFLWAPMTSLENAAFKVQKADEEELLLQESKRLLYVALTRARDRLYLCGFEGDRKNNDTWYDWVSGAVGQIAQRTDFDLDGKDYIHPETGEKQFALQLSSPQTAPIDEKQKTAEERIRVEPLPVWAQQPPRPEPSPPKPLTPSKAHEDDVQVLSPLGNDDGRRFKRGLIAHHLFQVLPEIAQDKWELAAAAYLKQPAHGLDEKAQQDLQREVLAVLTHPDFAAIFGAGSKAEVPVVGLLKDKALSGQIDRMVVSAHEVLIIDFKTNRPPPQDEKDVSEGYFRQMAIYRAALSKIYPDKTIRCALLWTDTPRLMPLSEKMLDQFAP